MMDVYSKTGRWKLYLAILGVLIALLPVFYSNYLAQNLAEREKTHVELLVRTLKEISLNQNYDQDMTYQVEVLEKLNNVSVVTVNHNGDVQLHNYPENVDTSAVLKRVRASGIQPLTTPDYEAIYWEYPKILTLIRYFPLLQLFLLLVYVAIGYAVFNLTRKEEQNRVWVGMAKETAHQLGTPISGIMGWIENLKSPDTDPEQAAEIVRHMEQDVFKLQQVSDRFSKIGSKPELHPCSLLQELLEAKRYMQVRASRHIVFDFPDEEDQDYWVDINPNLFSWVLENLLRNALDAMEGEGKIMARISKHHHMIHLEITDTGKGIPAGKFDTIFRPGYSTKLRGWGLGLSLAKRIIENYHNGRIYVKDSAIDQGTTFMIELRESEDGIRKLEN
ncbi:MAG: HAMP domain-containing histidine kinase [Saprospiraceae bacterium]|nr:HAMP domain-containing histidine kinase [Candidatus Vicinibacter proximus]MBL7822784.1 HAMP domain-containing histidine kinase [Saprospiraceae bacterium]MCC6843233.1 HAMP domain-containing histidine kinase [Saprospiraceae bacterium]HRG33013.1 HAMP domain-containing sensor histidine kinase [Saprospiraceae bacterium]